MEKFSSSKLAGTRNAPQISPTGESLDRFSIPPDNSQMPRIRPLADTHACSARRAVRGFMSPKLRGEISMARSLSPPLPDVPELLSLLSIPSSGRSALMMHQPVNDGKSNPMDTDSYRKESPY